MKLTKEEIVRVKDASPLDLFRQGIKSEETLDKYTRMLKLVTCEVFEEVLEGDFEARVKQLVKRGRDDPEWVRDLLISLSGKLRMRTKLPKSDKDYLNPDSIDNYYKPLKKLMDMNDVLISWKRIYATYPESNDKPGSRGWTREEIASMLKNAGDPMSRALILVLASSGVRVGGLLDLNWDDVTAVYRVDGRLTMDPGVGEGDVACAMLDVYRGSSEHYNTFVSLEAYEALQDYKQMCEKIRNRPSKRDDPVFITHTGVPKRTGHVLIRKRLTRIADKAGVRGDKKGKRFEVPIIQGFRRFWNKTCKEARSNDSRVASLIQIEYMLGHRGLVALDQNYYKTEVIELATAYVDLMTDLTIGNDERLKQSNQRMSANIQRLESEKDAKITQLEEKVRKMEMRSLEVTDAKERLEKLVEEIRISNERDMRRLMQEYRDATAREPPKGDGRPRAGQQQA